LENGGWKRNFSKGMVIVNPSSTQKITVQLPEGRWKTIHESIIESEIELSPATAAILQMTK
jgi:hypothetical protein